MNGSIWRILAGTAAGASMALLFAPTGVQVLRETVRPRAYIDLQRLQAGRRARIVEPSIHSSKARHS